MERGEYSEVRWTVSFLKRCSGFLNVLMKSSIYRKVGSMFQKFVRIMSIWDLAVFHGFGPRDAVQECTSVSRFADAAFNNVGPLYPFVGKCREA